MTGQEGEERFRGSLSSPSPPPISHWQSGRPPRANKLSAHIIVSTSTYNWPYVSPPPAAAAAVGGGEERGREGGREITSLTR